MAGLQDTFVNVYLELIKSGAKKIADVPPNLQESVKAILETQQEDKANK